MFAWCIVWKLHTSWQGQQGFSDGAAVLVQLVPGSTSSSLSSSSQSETTPPAPALCLCLAQPVRGLQWKGCKLWIRVVGRAVCGSFRMKIWSHIKWKHSHFYFDRETQNAHTLLINFRGSFLGKPFLGSPCPTVRKANWDSWRQIPFLSFRSHGKTH